MKKKGKKKIKLEIERRWIVLSIDPNIKHAPSNHIVQAHLDTPGGTSARVRITDKKKVEYTKKTGTGLQRTEENEKTGNLKSDLKTAGFWMDERIADIIQKRRYRRDGWEIDFYEGPLLGLVKAEFEKKKKNFPIHLLQLPPWIHNATEVTDTISDRLLARVARGLPNSKTPRAIGKAILAALQQLEPNTPFKAKADFIRQAIIDFPF